MTNPNDFKASQVQVNKIIVTGSFANETSNQLLIYNYDAQDSGSPNQGEIDSLKFDTSGIGTDVLLFVSGGIGEKDVADSNSVSVFGGDLHISGNLTVDGTYPSGGGGGGDVFWTSTTADVIETTGSISIGGAGNTVSGLWSAVLGGSGNTATGTSIFVHGAGNTANNTAAHAEGGGTTASGLNSHSEGEMTLASGQGSHAEGYLTTGSGKYSHTEGAFTQTGRLGLSIIGGAPDFPTNPSDWVFELDSFYGNITSAPSYFPGATIITEPLLVGPPPSTLYRYEIVSLNYDSALGRTYISASDTYGMGTYHSDGALTGLDFDTGLGVENVTMAGYAAHAEGSRDQLSQQIAGYALGSFSHSEGYGTIAFDNYSHAEGIDTRAYGEGSHAEGNSAIASGSYSHAEGSGTASGPYSHAEGGATTASGQYSHSEGESTTSSGAGSHAEGQYSTSDGDYSHAEGATCSSTGSYSHAEGDNTTSSGQYSHAEGSYSQSKGEASHAEGNSSIAQANYSHAEGDSTLAAAEGSHAEGYYTIASGSYSHAAGFFTISSGSYQSVIGEYNKRGNNFSLFVIGDGTGDANANRSDILRVNKGTQIGSGSVQVTGSFSATLGLSGSLTRLTDGTSYLRAGTNISITSQSNGAVTISSTGGGGDSFFFSRTANIAETSGSLYVTSSLRALNLSASNGATITGSLSVNGGVITNGGTTVDGGTIVGQQFEDTDTTGNSYGLVIKNSGTGFGAPFLSFVQGSTVASGLAGAIIGWTKAPAFGNIPGLNLSFYGSYPRIGIRNGAASTNIATFDVNGLQVTGTVSATLGLSGSLTRLANGTSYLRAGSNIAITSQSNGAVTVASTVTGKQHLASDTSTTTTTPQVIGQFSWVPADYTGLTSVRVRAVLSTDGTANHTGSIQIYNLTSGSFIDLIDTPATSAHMIFTGSAPTLLTSSNLLTGITNFDKSSTAVYEVRVSGSSANTSIVGGVELIFQ